MTAYIALGCECGGPDHGDIGNLKVGLYRLLCKHVTSTYCDAIDEYAPVLRVDGQFQTFGAEGLTRLRFAKKKRSITIDIQIPESVWRPKSPHEIRLYLATQVRAAILQCTERLKSDGCIVRERELYTQFDAAAAEYASGG